MLKMPADKEEPPSTTARSEANGHDRELRQPSGKTDDQQGIFGWIVSLFTPKPDPTFRETIEEYIEEPQNYHEEDSFSSHERELFSNLLKLRDMRVQDVMIPRADILAIDIDTPQKDIYELLKSKQHSRLPVYRGTLDEVVGTIHIKDLLALVAENKKIKLKDIVSDLPVVAPSMSVLDLLLEMRSSRRHMVLVVDEYGGIDGLVTIGDIIGSIVGEIEDEHDIPDDGERVMMRDDGTVLVDARLDIDEFEEKFGNLITSEEKEESETLGGLVSAMAGRVPVRGEVLTHSTGMVFEVMDADPRRINRLKIRNIPTTLG